jgi:23S rRNA (pseudouridine1915-N3)-methyltransferase
MLITIAAIGRLKAGAERELYERYLARASAAGRRHGLAFATRELPESRAASEATRRDQEAAALISSVPAGAVLVALDEHGKAMDSAAFATRIAGWRDDGAPVIVFAIGGPDGHGPGVAAKAALRLAFGAMTWPHQLVRIMLAEQLYRAVTIISGHPYHRS